VPADLTIVICTHNREALLRRALASLNAAARPQNKSVDLLVIPNACSDGTHAFLHAYRERQPEAGWLPLRFEPEPRPGKSHALNRAIRLLDSQLVAYVDDDHRVDAGYLAAVCAAGDAYPDSKLFCGRILPDWDGSEPAWVHDTGPYRIYPLPVPRYDQGPEAKPLSAANSLPGGGNLFLRRSVFQHVGGFSVDFGPRGHNLGGAEDLEWVERAIAAGAWPFYVPSVVQYHYVDARRLTVPYLMHKAFERSSSVIRLSNRCGQKTGVPSYMYRKLLTYMAQAAVARGREQRRFYLVRLAAAFGEMDGARRQG
jgi:GT2 family glycosyltransferase